MNIYWSISCAFIILISLLSFIYADSKKDYYELLGLNKNSFDTTTLKKAYRDLVKEYHPDRNKSPDAHSKFVEITHAYETLMDDEKREIYNKYGKEGLEKHASGGSHAFHDPFDIFAQFAGFGFRYHGQNEAKTQSPSIRIDIPVSLKEIFLGAEIGVDLDKQVICPLCRGTGAKTKEDIVKCSTCSGSGVKIVQQVIMGAFIQQSRSTCTTCNGKGKISKSQCTLCKGKRVERNHREGSIKIPKGAREGDKIVLENAGDEHPDKIPGHVIFHLLMEPHSLFQRLGDNLYTTQTITLQEALLGFTKKIEYLDETNILIQRTNITQPGYVQTIRGYGLPKTIQSKDKNWWDRTDDTETNSISKRGDLFVTFQIIFPIVLSSTEQQIITNLLKGTIQPLLVMNKASIPEHLDL